MSSILKSLLLRSHFNEYKTNHFHFLWCIHMVDGMVIRKISLFPSLSFITKHPENDKRAVYPETWASPITLKLFLFYLCVCVCVCFKTPLTKEQQRHLNVCLSTECISVLRKHFIFQRFQGLCVPYCYSLY